MYKHFFKRLFDFIISLVAIVCLSPLLFIVTIGLHFANKGAGAFFVQQRMGKNGETFAIFKYKTMTDERDSLGKLLPDGQRLTPIGRFIRSTSIDELPQLFNVLKGDMSLIGPRPLTLIYGEVLSSEHMRRCLVRPGITGWAQVHGRNQCKLSEKFEMDIWYVDNYNPIVDLKILFLTIKNVFLRQGIGEGGEDMAMVDDLNIQARIDNLKKQ